MRQPDTPLFSKVLLGIGSSPLAHFQPKLTLKNYRFTRARESQLREQMGRRTSNCAPLAKTLSAIAGYVS